MLYYSKGARIGGFLHNNSTRVSCGSPDFTPPLQSGLTTIRMTREFVSTIWDSRATVQTAIIEMADGRMYLVLWDLWLTPAWWAHGQIDTFL